MSFFTGSRTSSFPSSPTNLGNNHRDFSLPDLYDSISSVCVCVLVVPSTTLLIPSGEVAEAASEAAAAAATTALSYFSHYLLCNITFNLISIS